MKKFYFAFLIIIHFTCFSQYKQAVKYYNSFQYSKAIPLLKKVVNKNDTAKKHATVKLADCYRYIKDYKDAELYYQKAVEQGSVDKLVHYNYGTVLKNNNKYDEALKEFNLFLASNANDAKAKNAAKSCRDIKAWQSFPKEYEIANVNKINTRKSEFCPVVFDGKLFYISWQPNDLVNYEKYDYDGTPYLNIYYNTLNDEINLSSKKSFSKKINTNYHDGPICFSNQNQFYFSRVNYVEHKKDKAFINRPQLYTSTKKGKSWSKPQAFEYNNAGYSITHPSISIDGNYLFFSSDMPGGLGGMDIWVCKKNASTWDKPINLGADINTSGDEEFPFMRNDDVLFFSSDGLPGFGGLDIFSAKKITDKWILNRNEGLGINSLADDFGVFFTDSTKGYLSSNRDGGKGSDDVYKFTFTKKVISIDGTVLNSNDVIDVSKNIKVILEDTNGNRIIDTRTNNDGYFRFDNLTADTKYMVKIDESDAGFTRLKKYYYVDAKGTVTRVTVVNERGEKYVFKNLPSDPNALPELNTKDDVTLTGNLLYADNLPIANKELVLKDNKENILDETTTNAFGAFVFSKVLAEDNYVLALAKNDGSIPAGSKIILTNKNGKQLKTLIADNKGNFRFNLLASDTYSLKELKTADADLTMDLRGKLLGEDKKILPGIKIYLTDEKGIPLDTIVTDTAAKFEFAKLKAGKNYLFNIDENDERIKKMNRLFIADLKGRIVKELLRNRLKGFTFNILSSEKTSLKDIYIEDPWLAVFNLKNKSDQITIVENVQYAVSAYKLDAEGQRVMDKVIQLMKANSNLHIEISSYTDARGDDKANMLLSEKRAKFAVSYIISKKINATRLNAIGYGETKLLNNCSNGVTCSEEEHAKNRRTEFKIVDTSVK